MTLHIKPKRGDNVSKFPLESMKKDWHNLPNTLSHLRILSTGIPVFLLLTNFQDPTARWWAAIWYVLIALTDWVDGFFARRLNKQSAWGAFIDPVADKLLVLSMLVVACVQYASSSVGPIVIGVSVFIVLREIVLAWQIKQAGNGIVPPTWSGKVKTTLQMVMIGVWIAPNMPSWVFAGITCAALVSTLVSWIDYYRLYVGPSRKEVM